MKLSGMFVTSLLAAGALALTPLVHAQTNTSTNGVAPARRPGVESRMQYLTRQLNLTEDQKPKVQAVLEEEFKALQELPREQFRDKMPAIREETAKKLKAVLTDEQYATYQSRSQRGVARRGASTNAAPEKPGEEKKVEPPNH